VHGASSVDQTQCSRSTWRGAVPSI
jgi:hypothetical protein